MKQKAKQMIMTVDVEDWFQVENLRPVFPLSTWGAQEYRIEQNIDVILDLFSDRGVTATFFCLGMLAQKFPRLIRKIHANGHEVASHGFNHQVLSELEQAEIKNDIYLSKTVLEDVTGEKIKGYRAPSFSCEDRLYPLLLEMEFEYDSSVNLFSAHHRYGSVKDLEIKEASSTKLRHRCGLDIYPVQTVKLLGTRLPWGGGGYFRLLPYELFKWGLKYQFRTVNNLIFYFHPWEVDEGQPRVNEIGFLSKFRHYYGLANTVKKLDQLIQDFRFTSLSQLRCCESRENPMSTKLWSKGASVGEME